MFGRFGGIFRRRRPGVLPCVGADRLPTLGEDDWLLEVKVALCLIARPSGLESVDDNLRRANMCTTTVNASNKPVTT